MRSAMPWVEEFGIDTPSRRSESRLSSNPSLSSWLGLSIPVNYRKVVLCVNLCTDIELGDIPELVRLVVVW